MHERIVSIEIATGTAASAAQTVGTPARGKLTVAGSHLITSASTAVRWNVAGGNAVISNYGTDACGDIWPSVDGLRVVTKCGTVLRLSDVPSQDLTSNGRLSSLDQVSSAVHIGSRGLLFAIPSASYYYSSNRSDTEVQRYAYEFLGYESKFPLPGFVAGGSTVDGHGRHIFSTADGNTLVIVMQGSSRNSGNSNELTQNYGVFTTSIDSQPSCTYSIQPSPVSFAASGGSVSVSVTTQAACSWTPVATGGFFNLNTSGVSSGSGTFSAYANANSSASTLTGSISIAGNSVAVTQAGVACSYSLDKTALVLPRTGGSGVINITAGAGCGWSVSPSSGWFTATPASGSGPGAVTFSAGPNLSTAAQTASILIGGVSASVSQTGACTTTAISPLSAFISAAGGTGTINISKGPGCGNWTANTTASWLQVYPLTGAGSATTYTVFPNFSSQSRTAQIRVDGQAVTIVQSSAVGTSNERFVGQMYFNFFGRLASASEIAFHVGTLNGGLARADLVMNFFNAAEFNSGGRFIAGLYVGVMDRNAEYSGWLFQRNALSTNIVTQVGLVTNFLGSAEWSLKFGSPSNSQFVALLYRYILLREASQSEIDLQVNALTTGFMTRTTLANAFLNSAEFRNGTGPRLTAFLLYSTLLLRDPTPQEFAARIAELQSGTPVRTMVLNILSANEFNTLLL
jgi:hypothetical protein